jgi:predicted acyltransferase
MKQLGLRGGSRREPWLDLLRGLAVAGMVLVNNPGSWSATYWPLAHAEWHGLTPADVIFPLFLFIVGIAIVYAPSLAIPCKADTSVYVGLFTRSAVLFGLGVLLVGFPRYDLETLRVTAVLQRIAICYLFAAILFLNTGWRIHLATAVAILFGYFVLLISIPPPGCHSGERTGSWRPTIPRA